MKKLTAIFLAVLCLVCSFAPVSYADTESDVPSDEPVKISTLRESANYIFKGSENEIQIVPADFTADGEERNIYVVTAMGMYFSTKKVNHPFAAVLSTLNIKTAYYRMIKKFMLENIPAGSEVFLIGHSFGGMVMQQLRCDKELTESYDISATVTYGAPYIITAKSRQEGILVRAVDYHDLIPLFSPAIIFSRKNHKDAIKEDGGYLGDREASHKRSYRYSNIWDEYDVIGRKEAEAYYTYRPEDVISLSTMRHPEKIQTSEETTKEN